MTKKYPMYLAGQWVESDIPLDVINPYNGEAVGRTWLASAVSSSKRSWQRRRHSKSPANNLFSSESTFSTRLPAR